MTPDDVPLRRYLVALRAHARLVFVCGAIAVVAGAFAVSEREPTYTATARLLVTPVSDQELLGLPLLRDVGDDSRTMQTSAAVLDTSDIASAAATDLGESWTPGRVRRRVSVRPHGQSNVLDVTSRAPTRSEAVAIADAYAAAIIETRQADLNEVADEAIVALSSQLAEPDLSPVAAIELRDRLRRLQPLRNGPDPTISLIEGGQAAPSPLGTSPATTIALAALAGLAFGAIAANVLDALRGRPTVLEESALTDIIDAPVLARVVVPHRWRRRVDGQAFDDMALRYALGGPKTVFVTGSSPATEIAVCAVEMAKRVARTGARVAIIDAGGEVDRICALLSIDPKTGASSNGSAPDVRALGVPGVVNLQVLTDTRDDPDPSGALERTVAAARHNGQSAHLVVVVSPPVSDAASLAGVAAADEVVVVSRLGVANVDDLRHTANRIELTGTPIAGHVIVKRTAFRPPPS